MKQLITFIAVLLIAVPMMIFTADYKMALLATEVAKRDAKEATATAVLFYDVEEYSYGRFVLNDSQIIDYYNSTLDKYSWVGYIYDEDEKLRIYSNLNSEKEGRFVEERAAQLVDGKYTFTDAQDMEVEITGPCAIIILDNEKNYYRLKSLTGATAVRSAQYAVYGY